MMRFLEFAGVAALRVAVGGLLLVVCLLMPSVTRADDVPAKPDLYFNDYANVVDAGTADALNTELENFERQTSNQIVVAVYPKLQTEDSLDDFCYRTFQAWGVGQKSKNNGAVLFVFVQDHKMRIQTGYGLEGALPDITCVRIQDDTMAPYFKRGDYAGGLRAGINAMIAATKGEYKGTGRTAGDQEEDTGAGNWMVLIVFGLLIVFSAFRRTRGMMYGPDGIGYYAGWMLASGMGGRGGGGGGFGGGGGGGFGGGGFSGGGGSSGGGGASGSW